MDQLADDDILLGNRYRLTSLLGTGGMAEVHDAWDTRLDRPVAVKLLHPGIRSEPDMRVRFQAEARAAASLNHPNIVSVHDIGEHGDTPYMVMERLPGTTLADVIARSPLPTTQVRRMLGDVLAAVMAAHAAGILHRDIKPSNILLTPSGDTVKVADFGIAKTAGAAFTRTGEVLGTLAYLSPQRIEGTPASATDDVYAVGVVGYEALTGHPPFHHDNLAALARAILQDDPKPLRMFRADDDPALFHSIDRAIKRDKQFRFQSADEMLAALSSRTTPVPPPHSPQPQRPSTRVMTTPPITRRPALPRSQPNSAPRPHRAQRTMLLAGAGAALALLATTITHAAMNWPDQPPPVAEVSISSSVVPTPTEISPPPVRPVTEAGTNKRINPQGPGPGQNDD